LTFLNGQSCSAIFANSELTPKPDKSSTSPEFVRLSDVTAVTLQGDSGHGGVLGK
jgi:hypothetical protein